MWKKIKGYLEAYVKHISSQVFTGTELVPEQSQSCAECAGQSPGASKWWQGHTHEINFLLSLVRTQQRGSSFFSEQFLLTKNQTRARNNWLVKFRHSWPCPFWTKIIPKSVICLIWPYDLTLSSFVPCTYGSLIITGFDLCTSVFLFFLAFIFYFVMTLNCPLVSPSCVEHHLCGNLWDVRAFLHLNIHHLLFCHYFRALLHTNWDILTASWALPLVWLWHVADVVFTAITFTDKLR